jgi:hypothetical protein
MDTGSFPGVKRPGRGDDHTLPSSVVVKEIVELYLYSPSGPSWSVLGRTLYLLAVHTINKLHASALQTTSVNYTITEFYILLTVHLDVILVNDQLDALFLMYFFHASTCFEHKCSSSGGPNGINTSSGITRSGGCLSDVPVVSSWPARQTPTHQSVIPDDVLIQFGPPDDEHSLLETCRGMK